MCVLDAHKSQKKATDPLELEFQELVRLSVGAGNGMVSLQEQQVFLTPEPPLQALEQ